MLIKLIFVFKRIGVRLSWADKGLVWIGRIDGIDNVDGSLLAEIAYQPTALALDIEENVRTMTTVSTVYRSRNR